MQTKPTWKTDYEAHPLAGILPMLALEDYEALRDSIAANGQREPILVNKSCGRLVDGRNRLKACIELNREPVIKTVDLDESGVGTIIGDLNLNRRHLNRSQLIMCAMELISAIRRDALEKRGLATPTAGQRQNELSNSSFADRFKIDPSTLYKASHLIEKHPHMVSTVKLGELSIDAAIRKAQGKSRLSERQFKSHIVKTHKTASDHFQTKCKLSFALQALAVLVDDVSETLGSASAIDLVAAFSDRLKLMKAPATIVHDLMKEHQATRRHLASKKGVENGN